MTQAANKMTFEQYLTMADADDLAEGRHESFIATDPSDASDSYAGKAQSKHPQ